MDKKKEAAPPVDRKKEAAPPVDRKKEVAPPMDRKKEAAPPVEKKAPTPVAATVHDKAKEKTLADAHAAHPTK